MQSWIRDYVAAQKTALDSIPVEAVAGLIETFRQTLKEDRQIFVFGNGGSAANASHFVTDLGQGVFRQAHQALPVSFVERQRELDDGAGE